MAKKNLKDMTVKQRQKIEKEIGKAVVKGMLAAGYEVAIDNGGNGYEYRGNDEAKIIENMFLTDEEHLFAYTKDGTMRGFVYLIYGEYGFDVMNDYSTYLENTGVLKEALEIANKYDKLWTGA